MFQTFSEFAVIPLLFVWSHAQFQLFWEYVCDDESGLCSNES